jgi:hypothetical protein
MMTGQCQAVPERASQNDAPGVPRITPIRGRLRDHLDATYTQTTGAGVGNA